MALSLVLDPAQKVLAEPGFHQHISSAEALKTSQVGTAASDLAGLWAAPDTNVVMLRPLQISPHWLNSADQVASVIRLSAMVVNATDIVNKTIFEEVAFGNTDNPYIYHAPVGFPGTPSAIPMPGLPVSIIGSPYGGGFDTGLTSIANETEVPFIDYSAPATETGSVHDGRVICYTNEVLPANAPLYLRWFHPNPKIGHQTRYRFYFGQLAIEIAGNVVILYTDVSEAGDRSSFSRIWAKPMFGPGDFSPGDEVSWLSTMNSAESAEHDRSLLLIPYFRNRLLIAASSGTAYSPKVKETPVPAIAGSDHSWEITRADTAIFWVITPAPGRFQVQKVRFANGPAELDLPHTKIEYTPVSPPTVSLFADQEHGTSIAGVVSDPPSYTVRYTSLNACPPATTGAGDQGRTYGVKLTFIGETSHRWTPFFYGLEFNAPATLANVTTTPTTVPDIGSSIRLRDAMISWGDKPGDGRAEVKLMDLFPYALAPYYYRSAVPLKVVIDAVTAFTGISSPHEVIPLLELNRPRMVTIPAIDRWKELAGAHLRDQAGKYGQGHISVVLEIVRQAGIDTTGAETPPLTPAYNTPLGGLDSTIPYTEEQAKLVRAMWDPRDEDTAATYILRIAELFSGWDVGFRATGEFFYLPKDYFTTIALRFFHTHAARTAAGVGFENNPLVRHPVEFRTIEPEANVVAVIGAASATGSVLHSSLWVDWGSIKNPNVVNYLGRWKAEVPILGYALSCAELNRVARVVFQEVRRRRRLVSFESDFVPTLKIGQIIEVGTYGQFRLKNLKAECVRGNWSPTTYEGEAVEAGYGLP